MSDDGEFDSESDEDYVPSDGDPVSEVESDDEGNDEEGEEKLAVGKRKKQIRPRVIRRKQRKIIGGDVVEGSERVDEENERLKAAIKEEVKCAKEEKEKKRVDDLWSTFLSDVGRRPKNTTDTSINTAAETAKSERGCLSVQAGSKPDDKKVTVTKTYNFAGEIINHTEKVDASTREGKLELDKQKTESPTDADCAAAGRLSSGPVKLPEVTVKKSHGLSGVLGKIGKTKNLSCLDKSKMDWEVFKQKEGIEDELKVHNRGKEGYIERTKFLEWTDHKQFQLERNLRQSSSK